MDLERAAREHGPSCSSGTSARSSPDDEKFAAENAAWPDGVLLHVPEGVTVEAPLRAFSSPARRRRSTSAC